MDNNDNFYQRNIPLMENMPKKPIADDERPFAEDKQASRNKKMILLTVLILIWFLGCSILSSIHVISGEQATFLSLPVPLILVLLLLRQKK